MSLRATGSMSLRATGSTPGKARQGARQCPLPKRDDATSDKTQDAGGRDAECERHSSNAAQACLKRPQAERFPERVGRRSASPSAHGGLGTFPHAESYPETRCRESRSPTAGRSPTASPSEPGAEIALLHGLKTVGSERKAHGDRMAVGRASPPGLLRSGLHLASQKPWRFAPQPDDRHPGNRLYWHASHSSPFRIASIEQASASASVKAFVGAAGVSSVARSLSETVAFSMLLAPSVRR